MIYLVSNQSNAFGGEFEQISLHNAIELIKPLKNVGLDTETEGLDCHTKKLLSLQLGCKEFQVVFDTSSYNGKIPQELKDYLNESQQLFIIQNAKFDLQFLYKQNVVINNVFDTMLAETILTHGLQTSGRDLKTLGEKYCHVELDKSIRGQIITKGLNAAVIRYAAFDVVYLEEIMEKQLKLIQRLQLKNAVDLDNNFVKVLAYIEFCGIKLDWDKWEKKSRKDLEVVSEKLVALNNWLWDNGYKKYFDGIPDLFSGEMKCILNWNSSKQVIELFENIGINCTIKEKGVTKKTVEEKAIGKYKKDFPILELYFEYKAAAKLTSTYGLSWKSMINPVTNRIHTKFTQIVNTGRLSSGSSRENKPNLQNLPSDELTRSCFISEPGNDYIAADYSSQEQIVLANFSQEPNLINFYKKGFTDMHSYVAFLMYPDIRRCEIEDLTPDNLKYVKKEYPDKRKIAKNAGFAINYGGNGATIAKNCNLSKKDGEFVYNSYFASFPNLKTYFESIVSMVSQKEYILFNSVTGRKFFLKSDEPFVQYKNIVNDPFFFQHPERRVILEEYDKSYAEIQRLSQNYPIQGSSADISKLAGVIFFNQLKQRGLLFKVLIVNMVHDEFNIEAPKEISKEMADLLVQCMVAAGKQFCHTVKLNAVADIGDHWIH